MITAHALAFCIRFTHSFVATSQSAITTTARPGTVLEAAQILHMLECFTFLVCLKLNGNTLDVESVATKERKSEVTTWMVMDWRGEPVKFGNTGAITMWRFVHARRVAKVLQQGDPTHTANCLQYPQTHASQLQHRRIHWLLNVEASVPPDRAGYIA